MEWQPIETAPKNEAGKVNGPAILLWNESTKQVLHGCWATFICNNEMRTGWAIWSSVIIKYPAHQSDHKITHWMPLPQPPEAG